MPNCIKSLYQRTALIMPCLNEAENLKHLLPNLVESYRVILVDNGSTDGSSAIAKSFGAETVLCPQKGYGRAVLAGIGYLNKNRRWHGVPTDYVIVFDADGTSPPHYIPNLISALHSGDYDFVIGQRNELQKGSMPGHAMFGNWLQVTLIQRLTGKKYQDMGPLRGLKLGNFNDLNLKDQTWGFNVEMQIKAAYKNYRTKEIAIVYLPRYAGKSKISGSVIGSIRAGFKILYAVAYYYLDCRFDFRSPKRVVLDSNLHALPEGAESSP